MSDDIDAISADPHGYMAAARANARGRRHPRPHRLRTRGGAMSEFETWVQRTEGQETRRISVAVNDETVAALKLLVEREGVTLTEAIRRLIGYGDLIYRAIKEDDSDVLVKRRWSWRTRRLELL